MAKKHYGEKKYAKREEYAGRKQHENMEKEDSRMFGSTNGFSNMPQEVIMKPWPATPYGQDEKLDDTIGGIDNQMRQDGKRQKGGKYPEKY